MFDFFVPRAVKACPFYAKSSSVSRDNFQNIFFPKSRVLEGAMPPENVWEKVSVLNSTSNLEKAAYLPPPASHRTIFQRAQF
jgi:hypothetical protein